MTRVVPAHFPPIPAAVLAAGSSSRMGRVKALLPHPISDRPLVLHVTDLLHEAGAGPVAVVTGAHHAALAPVLEAADVPCLFNERHAEGQLASVRRALAWARSQPTASRLLITLVDLPDVAPATVRRLLEVAGRSAAGAVRPVHAGRHGHPVVWHASVWPRLDEADASAGARLVMRALAEAGEVEDVPVDDPGVLRDLDTPADYRAYVDAHRRHDDDPR